MINSLHLSNFQSHEDTLIEFDPGVNVVIGPSRSGKTSVLRGLKWVRYNKPAGMAFNSYWNRDKKKAPIEMFKASVIIGDKEITRGRDSTWNGYEVEANETYSAVGQDVPEQIEDLFNMTEVNIQSQFDTPFLLSESNAEIARFLNKTIKLDKIDQVLSKAELERRRLNKDIKEKTESISSLTEQLEDMSWVDDVEKLMISAERRSERLEGKREEILELKDLKESIINMEREVFSLSFDYDGTLKKISKAKSIEEKIISLQGVKENLDHAIENIVVLEAQIAACPENIGEALSLIKDAEKLDAKIEKTISAEFEMTQLVTSVKGQLENLHKLPENLDMLSESVKKTEIFMHNIQLNIEKSSVLRRLIEPIKEMREVINGSIKEIENISKELPESCPTCGNPLGRGGCID
jgi:exonuclease SbcC